VNLIKELQEMMKSLYYLKDKKRGKTRTMLKLVEELGELAEAVLLEDIEKVEEEMVDLVAWVLSLSNLFDLDLTHSFLAKYNHVCPKCKNNPCSCDTS